MKKKKVLICGASGFIGRNLFETLSQREALEVLGLCFKNNPFPGNPKVAQADLRIPSQVAEAIPEVDVLIHAAAVTAGSKAVAQAPHEFITDNVMMNTLLWQVAHKRKIPHVLFMSCTAMYPDLDRPVVESDTVFGDDLPTVYFGGAWIKIFAEKLARFYASQGKTRFTAIRHSNIYGPYDKFDLDRAHVFGASVTKVLTASAGSTIEVYGSGKAVRDLLYVSDLVRFVEAVMEKQNTPFEIFNVGLGEGISIKALVRKMGSLSGKNLEIVCNENQPSIDNRLVLNCTKAKRQVGWSPEVSLEEGILKTFDWCRDHC